MLDVEIGHEAAIFGGADRGGAEAGRVGPAGGGADAQARHSEQTFYRWKKQYAGLETDQVREFKQLTEENARLKRLVAELSLDKAVLQDVLSNGFPGQRS